MKSHLNGVYYNHEPTYKFTGRSEKTNTKPTQKANGDIFYLRSLILYKIKPLHCRRD